MPISFRLWNNEDEMVEFVNAVPGLAILETWSTALVGWEDTMEAGIEAEFARLESFLSKPQEIHSAQANIDLKLFLKKHLNISVNGQLPAADARPSGPITLYRYGLQNQRLPEKIMEKTPELHMQEAGTFSIIGWDKGKIAAEIARLEDEFRRQQEQIEAEEKAKTDRQEAAKKARWERRTKGHAELLAKAKGQQASPLSLQTLPGSYIVQLYGEDGEQHNDPWHDDDVMKLHIFPPESTHGVKASFRFGIVEGTMLLGMSRRAVEILREEQPKHSSYSEEEGECDDDTHVSCRGRVTGDKRPVGQIADPWGVQAARAKRQKMGGQREEASRPNRVYFQFVCKDVEGYPNVDDRNKHIGYFDFEGHGLAANGAYNLPCYGNKDEPVTIL